MEPAKKVTLNGFVFRFAGVWWFKVLNENPAPLYEAKDFGPALEKNMQQVLCGWNDDKLVEITITVTDRK